MITNQDISIGKKRWIKWVNINSSNKNEFIEIDAILKPTYIFWSAIEIHCSSGCCGLDAFSFWEDDIKKAICYKDKVQLINALKNVKTETLNSTKTIVSSSRLNCSIDIGVFIQLVDHILTIIEKNMNCES
jgi:hypothetical protein